MKESSKKQKTPASSNPQGALKQVIKWGMSGCSYSLSLAALLAPGLTGRRIFAQSVKLAGSALLKLMPGIYDSLDAGNVEFATGQRKRKPILQRRQFAALMERAERGEITLDEALQRAGISPKAQEEAQALCAEELFADLSPDMEVAVQYSGGGDSTLAGLLGATYFRRVHLLTCYHPFIGAREKASVNAQKLIAIFGPDKVTHAYVDTTRPLRKLLFGNYWQDLREYGVLPIAIGCLACKLSFDVGAISYAREHNVGAVLDGADLMIKFQLSQGHPEITQERDQFYSLYGLSFLHPCARLTDAATSLLLLGMKYEPSTLLYPIQPHCRGYDFLGQISTRFYILPRYGMEGLSELGLCYVRNKLSTCQEVLSGDKESQVERSVGVSPALMQ